MVIFLFAVAEAIEALSLERARNAIKSLTASGAGDGRGAVGDGWQEHAVGRGCGRAPDPGAHRCACAARCPRRQRSRRPRSGADHRREPAGGQGGRRPAVRRQHRHRRCRGGASSRPPPATARWRALRRPSRTPSRNARRRSALSISSPATTRRRSWPWPSAGRGRPAVRFGGDWGRLDLSGAGDAGDCLPLRPGHFDAGHRGQRPGGGGEAWHPDQGRRLPGERAQAACHGDWTRPVR